MVRMLYVNVCKCNKVCIIFYSVHIQCKLYGHVHTVMILCSLDDIFIFKLCGFIQTTVVCISYPSFTTRDCFFLIDAWSLYIFDIQPLYIFVTFHPWTYSMELTALVHITPITTPCTYYPHIYPLYIQYPHDFKESAKHFSGVKNYQRRIIISSYCIISVGASKRNFSAAKCPRTKKNSAMSSHTFPGCQPLPSMTCAAPHTCVSIPLSAQWPRTPSHCPFYRHWYFIFSTPKLSLSWVTMSQRLLHI